jgi:hypothetical protein
MKEISKEDILFVMQELIDNCEGAIMASINDDYLYNFACKIQEKIRILKSDFKDFFTE